MNLKQARAIAEAAVKGAADADARVATVEASLKTMTSSRDYHERLHRELERELNEAHAVLDALPGVTGRSREGQYGKEPNTLAVRVASLLWAVGKGER